MEPVHAIAASIGTASMILLWLALIAGLALARGWTMTRLRHSTMLAIHHGLALLGLCLGVVHGAAQPLGPAQTVKIVDTFVPFTNYVDPVGIGLGVIGTEIMIAIVLSVAIQKWLGFHRWRALHALVYAAYTLVTGHVLISGSEVEGWKVQGLVLVPWLILMALWLVGGSLTRRSAAQPGLDATGLTEAITTRVRPNTTTIQVNPSKCARFGFCEQEAPELFRLRGDGHLMYNGSVPEQQAEAALRAARACPARAIKVSQGGSTGSIPKVIGPPGTIGPPGSQPSGPPVPVSPGLGPVSARPVSAGRPPVSGGGRPPVSGGGRPPYPDEPYPEPYREGPYPPRGGRPVSAGPVSPGDLGGPIGIIGPSGEVSHPHLVGPRGQGAPRGRGGRGGHDDDWNPDGPRRNGRR